jgi:hypothetical protein
MQFFKSEVYSTVGSPEIRTRSSQNPATKNAASMVYAPLVIQAGSRCMLGQCGSRNCAKGLPTGVLPEREKACE